MNLSKITNLFIFSFIITAIGLRADEFEDAKRYWDIRNKAMEYSQKDCKKAIDFLDDSLQDPLFDRMNTKISAQVWYYDMLTSPFAECSGKYDAVAFKYLKKYVDEGNASDFEIFKVAKAYDDGSLGQKQNKRKALEYYLKGYYKSPIMHRHWHAYQIGKIYYELGKNKEAYPYLWLSSRKKNQDAASLLEKICAESPKNCLNTPRRIIPISQNNALRLHSEGKRLQCFINVKPYLVDLSFDVVWDNGRAIFHREIREGNSTKLSNFPADECLLENDIISPTDYIE